MTEILCDRALVLKLVDAYDDLIEEISNDDFYRNAADIRAALDRVDALLEELGLVEDDL